MHMIDFVKNVRMRIFVSRFFNLIRLFCFQIIDKEGITAAKLQKRI